MSIILRAQEMFVPVGSLAPFFLLCGSKNIIYFSKQMHYTLVLFQNLFISFKRAIAMFNSLNVFVKFYNHATENNLYKLCLIQIICSVASLRKK